MLYGKITHFLCPQHHVCFLSSATGFDGEQSLGVQLLQFGRRKRQVISGEPLPLSHRSYLSWLGFTAEGNFFKHCFANMSLILLTKAIPPSWIFKVMA